MSKPMSERICPIIKDKCIKDQCRFWIEVGGYEECIAFWIGDMRTSQMDGAYNED